jgi:hypothetical protein
MNLMIIVVGEDGRFNLFLSLAENRRLNVIGVPHSSCG